MLNERICLITGANSGIGKALSIALAVRGARVIMVCRDRTRGESALAEVVEKTGNMSIDLLIMDLSSQSSIRSGVCELKGKYGKINVLINNAGTLLFREEVTEDGIEATLAVNYLGPFLLTNLLLDLLLASSAGRVVNVVSEGLARGQFSVDHLTSNKRYRSVQAYSLSKQAEILFTYHLAERLRDTGVTSNCYYPGLVRTNLGKPDRGFRRVSHAILTTLLGPLFTPMEEAIKPGIFLALSKKAGKLNGKFLKMQRGKIHVLSAYDKELAQRLWSISENLTNLRG